MLADDLSIYIKAKHTQEKCIGFIDGYEAALLKLNSVITKCSKSNCKEDAYEMGECIMHFLQN